MAIKTLLIVRKVFRLTYRKANGFRRDIFPFLKVQEACALDYTSLDNRSKSLNVSIKVYDKHDPLDVVVDNTGLRDYVVIK